ncbi:MAG: S1 RNA-binding domain-containing protein [Polyangiaceae bacterium]|nr:S1 RNA-binding domain-containing protein [Polyangiaceae bacterium]
MIDEVTVLSVTDFGAFVRIEEGIEAIVMGNDIPQDVQLKPGDKVKAEVSNIDSMDRRITMTMRNVGATPQAEQYTALKREAASTKSATLGDLLKAKLGDKLAAMTGGEEAPAEEAKESDSEATE